MRLTDILHQEAVKADLTAERKKDVLEELCSLVAEKEGLELEPLLQVLLEREKLGSTGITDGIAIPHGKSSDIDKILVAFGRSGSGIDFDSMDGGPAYLFFLILAPMNSTTVHLKVLAKISRLLKDPVLRKELNEAKDSLAIYKLISERDSDF
ncbi:MAG: PTS sugar transporter subunit IIA [Deltaproteobacteria bacterium]|nr:PTS sugar transporter subunit IIA [Deltaproteobacteria bacterium]